MTKFLINHLLFLFALQVVSATLLLGQEWPAPKANPTDISQKSVFVVDGLISIGVPGEKYSWRKIFEDTVQGIGQDTYQCTKEGSSDVVALVIEGSTVPLWGRAKAVERHYAALRRAMRDQGFTDMKETPPKLGSSLGDVVKFEISAVRPNGEPVAVDGLTKFGKDNTFMIQGWATEADQAKQLSGVASTLREFGGRLEAGSSQQYKHVGFGFSFQPPAGMKKIAWHEDGVVALFRHPTGASINVRCRWRKPDLDLESVAKEMEKLTNLPLEIKNFKNEESGTSTVGGVDSKWQVTSYTYRGLRLKAIQHVFVNKQWFYVFTGVAPENRFQWFLPLFDHAMSDLKFE